MAKSETYQVHSTENYELFKSANENRVVRPRHVEALTRSIGSHGYLSECPILVVQDGDHLVVTDGQHRLAACQALQVPVYYRVVKGTKESISESIRVLNASARKWNDSDFLHHFVALGVPAYVTLSDFMLRNEMGIGSAMGVLSGAGKITRPVGIREKFRNGELEFDAYAVKAAQEIMDVANEIRNFHERLATIKRDEAFIKSVLILVSSKEYEHERFLANMEVCLSRFIYCTRVQDYLAILADVYNYRRQEGTRIVLSRKGITTLPKAEVEQPEEGRRRVAVAAL